MAATLAPAAEHLGPNARRRPTATIGDALAGGGGLVVGLGTLMVALDAFGEETNEGPAALVMLGLLVAGFVALAVLPPPIRPAAVTAVAIAVPGVFGFTFIPDASGIGDLRPFFILSILAWLACFVVPLTRGRPVFLALSALLLWIWVVGEVVGTDGYGASPVPSPPYVTPAEDVDALRGGTDVPLRPASLAGQVDLGELDPSDDLYPLAQDCGAGDDEACDELYRVSPIGSDFEEFGATCGGREPGAFPGTCAGVLDDDFGDDLGFEDDFGFDDDSRVEVDLFPTAGADDEALEVGLVSLLFAAGYLGALRVGDARGLAGLSTATVIPGVVTLVTAVAALGDASGEAIVGGLLAVVAGLVLAALGHLGGRRFTTWGGGALASIGAVVIAGDVGNLGEAVDLVGDDGVRLAGPGLVVIAFGVGVVALGFLAARVAAGGWPPRTGRPGPPPPPAPEPTFAGPPRPPFDE